MLALPLRLPTAPYGGHMGHFLLSTLILAGSTPFGNTDGLLRPETMPETSSAGDALCS